MSKLQKDCRDMSTREKEAQREAARQKEIAEVAVRDAGAIRAQMAEVVDERVKVNPIYASNIEDYIKVFLNGTCEKTDFKYTVNIVKDKQGYETVKISYVIDFNNPENSKCVRLFISTKNYR